MYCAAVVVLALSYYVIDGVFIQISSGGLPDAAGRVCIQHAAATVVRRHRPDPRRSSLPSSSHTTYNILGNDSSCELTQLLLLLFRRVVGVCRHSVCTVCASNENLTYIFIEKVLRKRSRKITRYRLVRIIIE